MPNDLSLSSEEKTRINLALQLLTEAVVPTVTLQESAKTLVLTQKLHDGLVKIVEGLADAGDLA